MSTDQVFQRDANHVPITNLGLVASKSVTFAAGTTGAIGTTTLFTVSGTVAMYLFAVCGTDLAGTGTIEVGVAGATAVLANQQVATSIDQNEVWTGATLAIGGAMGTSLNVIKQNVIQTIATNTVSGGELTYYCAWVPLSQGATVTAA